MQIQDCLLVIGELTMEKRYLEDKLEQVQKQLDDLISEAEESEPKEGGNE